MSNIQVNFGERIAEISISHFNHLPKTGKPNKDEWTVVSTIVQEENANNLLEVVALGTGTKCLGRNQLTDSGELLNDSHAEVVCRRAFLRYIYNSLLDNNSNLLVLTEKKRFSLRENVKFHFFTTLVPCGDASIFSNEVIHEKHGHLIENTSIENEEIPLKKIKLDVHTTGAKCLPEDSEKGIKNSSAPQLRFGAIRTKPGKGDPTLSVSCSDKLSKWVHLGIQGSVLSLLLEKPIYLSSITIGSEHYSEPALKRALYERFHPGFHSHIVKDHSLYKLTIPLLYHCPISEFSFKKSEQKQPCPSSIIYSKNGRLEVSVDGLKQGVTKKNKGKPSSRLKICKRELFQSFVRVSQKISRSVNDNDTYGMVKASSEYNNVKTVFEKDIFKIWSKKPRELEEFLLNG